ncbi:coth-domain-containing protein [Anaeromyces robustus]|uniref:Coth-domain-containing protein n=1 Tax=Anaeromyces robustus TaxID=1754192 RepID=A0A1Y1XG13_9FUNG|nr:coth-domain-containing protein [Anaeromyces robustus]|eukprot:ORX84642.1 coth-domain-containing protein [Anaeromyces robustus]
MKLNYNKIIPLAATLLFNIKKATAFDDLFRKHNVKRVELFEKTDFLVPDIKIHLNDVDFQTLFYGFQCMKDCSPTYLKENDDCYTAPWVDLNNVLEKAIDKDFMYFKMDNINNNNDIKQNDKQLILDVVKNKNHNITLPEFKNIVKNYSNYTVPELFSIPYQLTRIPDSKYFETSSASMTFNLGKEVTEFPKVKFSVGGRSTKFFEKVGYNINVKGDNLLYGAKQIRLRSVTVDPTFMRDKLSYDLFNIMGIPCLSANYARLFINDTFMGLYLLRDAYKSQWVQNTFGEVDTKHIYKCSGGKNPFFNCANDDEDVTDNKDWEEFLDKLDKAKTRKDLEEFFDVDTYIRSQVARYLIGALDHQSGNNNNVVYMYHDVSANKDIWIPLLYDFDMNFGNFQKPNTKRTFVEEIVDKNNPLYSILELNNESEEVKKIMDEIMRKVFNPVVLVPRIDQLRTFLKSYVKEDRTKGDNGRYPGRFDIMATRVEDLFTYSHFKHNSEFTTIVSIEHYNNFNDFKHTSTALGLKQWVIERFQYACDYYKLDCSYVDELMKSPYLSDYTIKEETVERIRGGCKGTGYACCILDYTPLSTQDQSGDWGREGGLDCFFENGYKEKELPDGECWASFEGYPCCEDPKTPVSYVNKQTRVEYGFEHGEWCGISSLQGKEICPDYTSKYRCCTECNVSYTGSDGHTWGIEYGQWCSIPYTCQPKPKPKDPKPPKK